VSAPPPLWPFGHGLSYTSFALSNCARTATTTSAASKTTAAITHHFECSLANTGPRAGDEVVLVYHRFVVVANASTDTGTGTTGAGAGTAAAAGTVALLPRVVPFKKLVNFERVSLAPGETTRVQFAVDQDKAFSLTMDDGTRVCVCVCVCVCLRVCVCARV
jgi:beta-xylosidase